MRQNRGGVEILGISRVRECLISTMQATISPEVETLVEEGDNAWDSLVGGVAICAVHDPHESTQLAE